jgi:hypothetical protein
MQSITLGISDSSISWKIIAHFELILILRDETFVQLNGLDREWNYSPNNMSLVLQVSKLFNI